MPIIDIHCKPSKILTLFLLLLGFVSVVVIFELEPLTWPFKCGLFIIILIYVIDNVKYYGLLTHDKSLLKVQLLFNNNWRLTTKKGQVVAKLHAKSITNTFFAILFFKIENQHFCAVSIILRGSIDKENYRNLLVYLRMKT